MEKTRAHKIAKACQGTLILGEGKTEVIDVVIDSRVGNKGALFVALEGEQTDGHRFIKNAYDNGVRTFLISNEDVTKEYAMDVFEKDDLDIILVDDTLVALQELACEYLRNMT